MSSSNSNPKGGGHAYGRFIPREELQDFASWKPGAFGAPAATVAPDSAEQQALVHAARQAGYQEGYRDGLVALDNFKRSVMQQNAAQFGAVLQQFDEQLDALEFDMARSLASVAASIAQQVVRDELAAQPQRIARVTQEAVEAVLLSARHIVVQVNPQDLTLVEQGAADAIAARGARLVGDATIERGGCRVLSDVGTIDARIGARWQHASAAVGVELPWSGDEAAPAAGSEGDASR
jgi:flagellar assembly protein FliH